MDTMEDDDGMSVATSGSLISIDSICSYTGIAFDTPQDKKHIMNIPRIFGEIDEKILGNEEFTSKEHVLQVWTNGNVLPAHELETAPFDALVPAIIPHRGKVCCDSVGAAPVLGAHRVNLEVYSTMKASITRILHSARLSSVYKAVQTFTQKVVQAQTKALADPGPAKVPTGRRTVLKHTQQYKEYVDVECKVGITREGFMGILRDGKVYSPTFPNAPSLGLSVKTIVLPEVPQCAFMWRDKTSESQGIRTMVGKYFDKLYWSPPQETERIIARPVPSPGAVHMRMDCMDRCITIAASVIRCGRLDLVISSIPGRILNVNVVCATEDKDVEVAVFIFPVDRECSAKMASEPYTLKWPNGTQTNIPVTAPQPWIVRGRTQLFDQSGNDVAGRLETLEDIAHTVVGHVSGVSTVEFASFDEWSKEAVGPNDFMYVSRVDPSFSRLVEVKASTHETLRQAFDLLVYHNLFAQTIVPGQKAIERSAMVRVNEHRITLQSRPQVRANWINLLKQVEAVMATSEVQKIARRSAWRVLENVYEPMVVAAMRESGICEGLRSKGYPCAFDDILNSIVRYNGPWVFYTGPEVDMKNVEKWSEFGAVWAWTFVYIFAQNAFEASREELATEVHSIRHDLRKLVQCMKEPSCSYIKLSWYAYFGPSVIFDSGPIQSEFTPSTIGMEQVNLLTKMVESNSVHGDRMHANHVLQTCFYWYFLVPDMLDKYFGPDEKRAIQTLFAAYEVMGTAVTQRNRYKPTGQPKKRNIVKRPFLTLGHARISGFLDLMESKPFVPPVPRARSTVQKGMPSFDARLKALDKHTEEFVVGKKRKLPRDMIAV